ncbi:MAG TPA: hypothetical protein VJW73_18965 [Gemmatimonadaceae bacterium]|nr:hypothetical protein [Gemmatimonadaceae bacterium]
MRCRCSFYLAVVAVPATLAAQLPNRGRLLSTPSAAALGDAAAISVGVSSVNDVGGSLFLTDFKAGPGAFRLLASHHEHFSSFGGGYGAALATRELGRSLTATVGGELSLGYYATHFAKNDLVVGNGTSLNAHLALPLALHLGVRDWLSATPYVAPYVETGAAPSGYWMPIPCDMFTACEKYVFSDHFRTAAAGAALGMRLTIWHVGLDAAYGDALRSAKRGQPASFAISLRL